MDKNIEDKIQDCRVNSEFWSLAAWMVGIGWGVSLLVAPEANLQGLPVIGIVICWGLAYIYDRREKELSMKTELPKIGTFWRLATYDIRLSLANGARVKVKDVITQPTPEFDEEVLPMVEIEFEKVDWHVLTIEHVRPDELVPCYEPF